MYRYMKISGPQGNFAPSKPDHEAIDGNGTKG